ncbi:hypothetical protein ACVJBD_005337 [Rhizobium mongolense]
MTKYSDEAKAILAANDRGGYTVPTDRLYPFQWNWDSAFVAMGFAAYDIDRAPIVNSNAWPRDNGPMA